MEDRGRPRVVGQQRLDPEDEDPTAREPAESSRDPEEGSSDPDRPGDEAGTEEPHPVEPPRRPEIRRVPSEAGLRERQFKWLRERERRERARRAAAGPGTGDP